MPNWKGFEDDLAEEPNWPPGGKAGVAGKVQGEGSKNTSWGQSAPQLQSQAGDNGAGSVINKAADYLAKRRIREATRIANEGHERDRRGAGKGREGNDENKDANVLMSRSTTALGDMEEEYNGGGGGETKFPPL